MDRKKNCDNPFIRLINSQQTILECFHYIFVDIPPICISSKLRLTRFRYNTERMNRVIKGSIICRSIHEMKMKISFLFRSRSPKKKKIVNSFTWINNGGRFVWTNMHIASMSTWSLWLKLFANLQVPLMGLAWPTSVLCI